MPRNQWPERDVMLNVGAVQPRTVASGPGERFAIWLQGCRLRCAGCINPEFQPEIKKWLVAPGEMAARILKTKGIEGVTYTGGEPTLQAQGLALLSDYLRGAGLSIVCYSGYTLEQLQRRQDPWLHRLLAQVDVLIDGPFVKEQAAPLLWRGSRNQRVHFLTDRYRAWTGWVNQENAQVELAFGARGFTTTGFWPESFLERLRKALADDDAVPI